MKPSSAAFSNLDRHGKLTDWDFMALSAQIGYFMPLQRMLEI